MKITRPNQPDLMGEKPHRVQTFFRQHWRWWIALTITLYTLALIVIGMFIRQDFLTLVFEYDMNAKNRQASSLNLALQRLWQFPGNYLDSLQVQTPERMIININFENFEKIRKKRIAALRDGVLLKEDDDYVPATIRHRGKTTEVKLRLKGDMVDHLEEGEKWSFKIVVKGSDQFMSMRQFTIQAPRTRGYQQEIIFLHQLENLGIMTPKSFFADVIVNGKETGYMLLQEHFTQELLTQHGKPQGVIVRYDETEFWEDFHLNKRTENNYDDRYAPISTFNEKDVLESKELTQHYQAAIGLMRGYQLGKLRASDIYDVEKLANFMAATEVWNLQHALFWRNPRYYYNPYTGKLEPIVYDTYVNTHEVDDKLLVPNFRPNTQKLLEDPEIFRAYLESVRKLSRDIVARHPDYQALKKESQQLTRMLHKEFPFLTPYNFNQVENRAQKLLRLTDQSFSQFKRSMTPKKPYRYHKLLHVYLEKTNAGQNVLELVNITDTPVTVTKVIWKTSAGKTMPFKAQDGLQLPLEVPRYESRKPVPKMFIPYQPPSDPGAILEATVTKANHPTQTTHGIVSAFPSEQRIFPRADLSALQKIPYLQWKPSDKTLTFKPGAQTVKNILWIPAGIRLVIPAGTRLRFSKNAGIISDSPIDINGTADRPVVLDSISSKETWAGIAVRNTRETSRWQHVSIKNSAGFPEKTWAFKNGITFYNTQANLTHCTFGTDRSDNALLFHQAIFEVHNSAFLNTRLDALDSEFSRGTIIGNRYQSIGGDAMDLDHSRVFITDNTLADVADKAISAGEKSHADIRGLDVRNARIGVASKNESRILLEKSIFKNMGFTALASYVKNPVYGPASIIAKEVTIENSPHKTLVQQSRDTRGSNTITLNGETAAPDKDLDLQKL